MVRSWHSIIFSDCDYRTETDVLETKRHPMWNKVAAIRRALASMPDGQILLWLDADAVAVKKFDVCSVLPAAWDFGAVENGERQLNAGVIFMRNCESIRRLWDAIWKHGAFGETPHHDQSVMNHCLVNVAGVRFGKLCSRFNWYPRARRLCAPSDVVIRAFHQVERSEMVGWFRRFVA